MNWLPVTPDLELPNGTELLALKKRSKFPSKWRDKTVAKWDLLELIRVARVGDLCGEKRPDRDRLTWYGKGYQSAYHDPHESFEWYALLSDLALPPIAAPDPDEIAEHERWRARSDANARAFSRALGAHIEAHMKEHPELWK